VILELKFTARYPNWFRDLVETFNCMQMGAAKYSEGISPKARTGCIAAARLVRRKTFWKNS